MRGLPAPAGMQGRERTETDELLDQVLQGPILEATAGEGEAEVKDLRELAFRLRCEASRLPNKFSVNDELFQTMNEAAEFIEAMAFDPGMYDRVDTYPDCTVEVWLNSSTGQCSIGWWENGKPPVEM